MIFSISHYINRVLRPFQMENEIPISVEENIFFTKGILSREKNVSDGYKYRHWTQISLKPSILKTIWSIFLMEPARCLKKTSPVCVRIYFLFAFKWLKNTSFRQEWIEMKEFQMTLY